MCQDCEFSATGKTFWWGGHFDFFTHGSVNDMGCYRDSYCPHYLREDDEGNNGAGEDEGGSVGVFIRGACINMSFASSPEFSRYPDEIYTCCPCLAKYMRWAIKTFDVRGTYVYYNDQWGWCKTPDEFDALLRNAREQSQTSFQWSLTHILDFRNMVRAFVLPRGRNLLLSRARAEVDFLVDLNICLERAVARSALLPRMLGSNDLVNLVFAFVYGRRAEKMPY